MYVLLSPFSSSLYPLANCSDGIGGGLLNDYRIALDSALFQFLISLCLVSSPSVAGSYFDIPDCERIANGIKDSCSYVHAFHGAFFIRRHALLLVLILQGSYFSQIASELHGDCGLQCCPQIISSMLPSHTLIYYYRSCFVHRSAF